MIIISNEYLFKISKISQDNQDKSPIVSKKRALIESTNKKFKQFEIK